jgi:hypothetical protein
VGLKYMFRISKLLYPLAYIFVNLLIYNLTIWLAHVSFSARAFRGSRVVGGLQPPPPPPAPHPHTPRCNMQVIGINTYPSQNMAANARVMVSLVIDFHSLVNFLFISHSFVNFRVSCHKFPCTSYFMFNSVVFLKERQEICCNF